MAKIVRKTVEGVGNGNVDVTGMIFANVEGNVTIEYTIGGVTYSRVPGRLILPPNVTSLKIIGTSPWKVTQQNSVPAINQSEIHFAITDSRKLLIEGDDNIVFRGQDVDPVTVSIAGIKDDIEQLSKQYMTALGTGTVTEAAKYCKLKTAVLARYAN